MPELTAILISSRDRERERQKFMAALQGVDLDKEQGKSNREFEDLKARVFSRGQAADSKDILSLQGINAQQAGFAIGTDLEYVSADDNFSW